MPSALSTTATAVAFGTDRAQRSANDRDASSRTTSLRRDWPTAPTEFDGRSDYFAFINNGIPAGGLFTGAEEVKTEEQAASTEAPRSAL